VGEGFYNRKTKKWQRVLPRSSDYNTWLQYAAIAWRKQYPRSVSEMFAGRVRMDFIFIWSIEDRGAESSDLDNRQKVTQDFLQHKFFKNDNQIDEYHAFRRISRVGQSCVKIRISEIPDRRYIDALI